MEFIRFIDMKIQISILLILLCAFPCYGAKVMIITREKDAAGNNIYVVKVNKNQDGSFRKVVYTSGDNISKLAALANKNKTGLTKNSDMVIIYFNDDGTVNRIFHQVNSTAKTESGEQVIRREEDQAEVTELTDEVDAKPES